MLTFKSIDNTQAVDALNWFIGHDDILWRNQVQRLGIVANSLPCWKWDGYMKDLEMTEHSVRWNGILVLTAYEYLILAVVDDILVHGVCDSEVKKFQRAWNTLTTYKFTPRVLTHNHTVKII